MPQSTPPDDDQPMNSYLKYSGMGIQMIVVIGVFAFAGYKLDQYLGHTTQWLTALLSLVGVFVSLYIVFKSLKN
jgi:F0F1-type ATP synthase assembly protein I